ncbi:hypothetical protein PENTCL1PPCAC_24126, partial [Pristionchus entomophagus]
MEWGEEMKSLVDQARVLYSLPYSSLIDSIYRLGRAVKHAGRRAAKGTSAASHRQLPAVLGRFADAQHESGRTTRGRGRGHGWTSASHRQEPAVLGRVVAAALLVVAGGRGASPSHRNRH